MSDTPEEKPKDEDFFGASLRKAASLDDSRPTIDLLAEEAGPGEIIPFGEGRNLKALREARDELVAGSITASEYVEKVKEVHKIVQRAVDILGYPQVTSVVDELTPEEMEVMDLLKAHTEGLLEAVESLLLYGEHQDLDELEDGMARVEEEMHALSSLQAATLQESAAEPSEGEDVAEVVEDPVA